MPEGWEMLRKWQKDEVGKITLHFGVDRVVISLPYNKLTLMNLTYREKYLLM